MAGRIKGITIEIGGDTTGLDKALRGVNSGIKTTQKELKDVEKALKLDPKNTELLEQKQRALAKAVEATSEKLKMLKEAQKQAAEQLAKGDIGQEQYDALTREITFTEAELKKATKAAEEFSRQNTELNRTLQDVSSSAGRVAEATKKISTVSAGVVAGIAGAAYKTSEWADDLKTLSQQTGITTDELQKMQYASELVDVEVSAMTGALAKLTKNMASTSAGTQEAFDRIGVSVRDAGGQMRNSTAVFYDTLAALSKVGNETERDQIAMQLFGRSANELAGIIDDGGAALKAYGDEAERNGKIIESGLVDSMASFNDKIEAFKASALPELIKAGGAAIEALTPTIEALLGVLTALLSIIGSVNPTVLQIITTMAIFGATLSPIASGVAAVSNAIYALSTGALTNLITVMNTTGGKLTVVLALIGLLVTLISQVANAWGDMSGWQKAISVMGALVVAATAAAIALGAVNSAATMGLAAAAIVAGIIAITAAVNAATKTKNSSGNITGAITTVPSGGGSANYNTYNTYNTTTTNYGMKATPINVNIDGKTAATALYDPLQELNNAHGVQYTR